MKLHILCATAVAVLAFAACQSENLDADYEGADAGSENLLGVSKFHAPAFPQADGSASILTKSKQVALRTLLNATDPTRAMDWSNLEITQAQFDAIKAKADELCASATSDLQKIQILNEWVKKNVTYTEGKDNNAYTVFRNKVAICQGYANLFKAMVISQGIPCTIVNGYLVQYPEAPVEFNPGHAWNYAYAGNKWYVCDPTNSTKPIAASSTADYQSLAPFQADFTLFEDDTYDYNFFNGYLNISRVKLGTNDLVLPFSVNGIQVNSFNPSRALPTSIQRIYVGQNITTFGNNYTIIGLRAYPSFDEEIYVDPANKALGSDHGIVYNKDSKGELTDIYYIPQMMSTIVLRPMEKVEKNTIYMLQGVHEIVFQEGTKVLESFAIEQCDNLETVYVPEDCVLEEDAIFKCPTNVQIVRGLPSSINRVRL